MERALTWQSSISDFKHLIAVLLPPLQLWLALASLCVLDQDHVDRLSSGRWMGKDGQQKQMVRLGVCCENLPFFTVADSLWGRQYITLLETYIQSVQFAQKPASCFRKPIGFYLII
jgi:hypothetical protein